MKYPKDSYDQNSKDNVLWCTLMSNYYPILLV